MRLIERIAARFGFYRDGEIGRELVVFATGRDAVRAGFHGSRHPQLPHAEAWWPGRGVAALRRRPIKRVTITQDVRFHRTEEGSLTSILGARQMVFGDTAVWIEL